MSIVPVHSIRDVVIRDGVHSGTPATAITLLVAATLAEPAAKRWPYAHPDDCPLPLDEEREVPLSAMLRGRLQPGQFARMGEATLWRFLQSCRPSRVLITGSEPCSHDLSRLVDLLKGHGKSVQVETSGIVYPLFISDDAWLTLRPAPMKNGHKLPVLQRVLDRANEIIAKIGRPSDVEHVAALTEGKDRQKPVWLFPGDQTPWLFQVCVDAAKYRGWRVSGPRDTVAA